MMSVSRLFFIEQTTIGALQLALRDYFPESFTNFLYSKGQQENLPPYRSTEAVSIVLLLIHGERNFEPLEVALNRVWGISKNRSFFRNQLVSLALISPARTGDAFDDAHRAHQGPRANDGISAAVLPALVFKLAAMRSQCWYCF